MNAQPLLPGSELAACSVRACQPADTTRWNAFVRRHPEGTFFHLAEWQQVLAKAFGHRTHYLLAEQDGEIRGVLPLAAGLQGAGVQVPNLGNMFGGQRNNYFYQAPGSTGAPPGTGGGGFPSTSGAYRIPSTGEMPSWGGWAWGSAPGARAAAAEPAWRKLERLREEKRTAGLLSDFEDYEVDESGAETAKKPRRVPAPRRR